MTSLHCRTSANLLSIARLGWNTQQETLLSTQHYAQSVSDLSSSPVQPVRIGYIIFKYVGYASICMTAASETRRRITGRRFSTSGMLHLLPGPVPTICGFWARFWSAALHTAGCVMMLLPSRDRERCNPPPPPPPSSSISLWTCFSTSSFYLCRRSASVANMQHFISRLSQALLLAMYCNDKAQMGLISSLLWSQQLFFVIAAAFTPAINTSHTLNMACLHSWPYFSLRLCYFVMIMEHFFYFLVGVDELVTSLTWTEIHSWLVVLVL